MNNKIAIEVDGEYWHKDRKEDDKKRDKIVSKKYKVLRINAKNILNDFNNVIKLIGELM